MENSDNSFDVEIIPPRKSNGQFQKGFSGKQYAKPVSNGDVIVRDVQEHLKEITPLALEVIAKLMVDKTASPTTRLNAAKEVLNRSMGKPAIVVQQRSDEVFEEFDVSALSIEAQREIVLQAIKSDASDG